MGSKPDYGQRDNLELKALSYWPAEDYLNIWVAQIQGDILGYAQFPVSNQEGLEEASNNRLTDGIVIDPEAFGSINKDPVAKLASQFDLGRTVDQLNGKVRIYPNHTNSRLIIDLDESFGLTSESFLLDLNGKIILQKFIRSGDELDLNGIRQGVYILLLKSDKQVFRTKIEKR